MQLAGWMCILREQHVSTSSFRSEHLWMPATYTATQVYSLGFQTIFRGFLDGQQVSS